DTFERVQSEILGETARRLDLADRTLRELRDRGADHLSSSHDESRHVSLARCESVAALAFTVSAAARSRSGGASEGTSWSHAARRVRGRGLRVRMWMGVAGAAPIGGPLARTSRRADCAWAAARRTRCAVREPAPRGWRSSRRGDVLLHPLDDVGPEPL